MEVGTAKKCVITYLPNGLISKMDGVQADHRSRGIHAPARGRGHPGPVRDPAIGAAGTPDRGGPSLICAGV